MMALDRCNSVLGGLFFVPAIVIDHSLRHVSSPLGEERSLSLLKCAHLMGASYSEDMNTQLPLRRHKPQIR
jgi:hypothetical protein